jgi:hypothetical protein
MRALHAILFVEREGVMASSLIIELSRRITRQLDLGKGMFFDADAMAVLAECGALELIQKAAADHLRERAAERLKAREPEALPASRRRPGERRTYDPRRTGGSDFFEAEPRSPLGAGESGAEALARAQRILQNPSRVPPDNVTILRPKRISEPA